VTLGDAFQPLVKAPFLLNGQAGNRLDDMKQNNFSLALDRKFRGDAKDWVVPLGQVDWQKDSLEHCPSSAGLFYLFG
jgi:hypothetical protein